MRISCLVIASPQLAESPAGGERGAGGLDGNGIGEGVDKRNLPTAPLVPVLLSIAGTGFGRAAYSGRGRLGVTSCSSTAWVAETQVLRCVCVCVCV